MSLIVTWVRDRDPPAPGRYPVVVCIDGCNYRRLSVRDWCDARWLHMASSERIECWAEGLRLPELP